MQVAKILRRWPWLVLGLAIICVLLWPFIHLSGDLKVSPVKISTAKKQNNLPATAEPVNPETIPENILVFGGDVMLSRSVNAQMEKYNDYTWPFEKIYPLFHDADLAIANLESPYLITNNYLVPSGSFSFKANPKSIAALSLAGFDVLSLANNHSMNQGAAGISDSNKILSDAGISVTGEVSSNLVIKESNGVKFGFLSYTYAADSSLTANMLNIPGAISDIKNAKSKADVVVVMMHAGTEYQTEPNSQQKEFARAAIDAGVDLVVGTHPHWIQTVEKYKGKTIIYSLGNLIFDQMWSHETSVGLVAKAYFKNNTLDKIEYIPVNINNYGQAEVMPDGPEKVKIVRSLIGN